MASQVIQTIHHVWKSTGTGHCHDCWIHSDLWHGKSYWLPNPTSHPWLEAHVFGRWDSSYETPTGKALLMWTQVYFHPLFLPLEAQWTNPFPPTVSPQGVCVGGVMVYKSGRGQIRSERHALKWAHVFVPIVQGMQSPSLIHTLLLNCSKISSQFVVNLCQAWHQLTAVLSHGSLCCF